MAINVSPEDAAQRWSSGLAGAQSKWEAGVQAVTVSPTQLAARAAPLWARNTAAAQQKFAANSARISREAWIEATVTKGGPRLGQGAQAAQPKMAAVMAKLFPYINQVTAGLPPRGDLEANINRSATFARQMAKFTM
jgi:hypothetical protein